MPSNRSADTDFISQITKIIEDNISNEQFGVSELADAVGMSRSNLLRKIKKISNLSVSQFIRNIRLEKAKEILAETSLTVSEVSYKVGFGSPSYFIKCFGDYYGFPPGELSEQKPEKEDPKPVKKKTKIPFVLFTFAIVVVLAFVLFVVLKPKSEQRIQGHKSIAVLPFINDSSDSSNVYIINGLMESTLNNLQQIEDLRVISRTSVEKYRNNYKTTPEIAKELNATYLIEGSGQKNGNQIFITIQLIEAASDNHLWSKQYQRDTQDIFALQIEIAKNIADEIEVIITPEEAQRIEKAPTENLEAYDTFLKGLNLLNQPGIENSRSAIPYFLTAIQLDNEFARAYAAVAISYYWLDEEKTEKLYSDSINYYADQALFYDSKLPQSLIAKALFYMAHEEHELAVPYFEKALAINPNSDLVLLFLLDLYANHLPNTQKYLEYALTGLEIDLVAAYDSTTASYSYLHISNALIQSGFVDEAENYINKSLEYLPSNLYSEYLKAFILYAKDKDLEQLKNRLLIALEKDPTRLDIMQEVAKAFYYLGDYETSLGYYEKFVEIKNTYNLNIYRAENGKIGVVCDKLGLNDEADKFLNAYLTFAENDPSIYHNYCLAMYYSYIGKTDKAIEYLKLFAEEENFHYWTVLFTPIDPLVTNLKSHPDFKKVFKKIEDKFNNHHTELEQLLIKKRLL